MRHYLAKLGSRNCWHWLYIMMTIALSMKVLAQQHFWIPEQLKWSQNRKYIVFFTHFFSATIYLFKVNIRNTKKRCGMCSKLKNTHTRTTSMTSFWCFYCYFFCSGIFIVDYQQISPLFLVFLSLTLIR